VRDHWAIGPGGMGTKCHTHVLSASIHTILCRISSSGAVGVVLRRINWETENNPNTCRDDMSVNGEIILRLPGPFFKGRLFGSKLFCVLRLPHTVCLLPKFRCASLDYQLQLETFNWAVLLIINRPKEATSVASTSIAASCASQILSQKSFWCNSVNVGHCEFARTDDRGSCSRIACGDISWVPIESVLKSEDATTSLPPS